MIRKNIDVQKEKEVEIDYTLMINRVEDEFGSYAWREIRAGDYWEIKDSLNNTIEKQKFTIQRIAIWIKKNK